MLKFKIVQMLAKVGLRKGKTLYYAQQTAGARFPFDAMCRRIETATALSEADVLSCMHALVKVFEEELLQGKTIELPPIGSFRLVCGSKRMNTVEEVTVHTIGKVRVRYSPSKRLNEVAAKTSFSIEREEKDKKGSKSEDSSQGSGSHSGGSSSGIPDSL